MRLEQCPEGPDELPEQPEAQPTEPEPEQPELGSAREENLDTQLSAEAAASLDGEVEADPYEVAAQIFQFRARQLQHVGELPRLEEDMTDVEYDRYWRAMTALNRQIHEELGLLWPPPWLDEEE